MRLSDRHLPGDLAPDLDYPRRSHPASFAVAQPVVESHGQFVGVVRPAFQRNFAAFYGQPIVVGRRAGGSEPLLAGPVRSLRVGADILASRLGRLANVSEHQPLRLALVVSVVLHLAAILMLVPVPGRPVGIAPVAQQRQVEMVFVRQPQTTRGAPPTTADAAAKPDLKTAAMSPPLPSTSAPSQPAAAAAAPAQPAGAAAPHWQTSMLDEPGDAADDESAYTATSDDMRPTRPDSAYRNMPPRYPEDAARHGQRGVVDVIVHVTPDGRAGQVEVAASSGVASLDHAAVAALSKWHFQPQMSGTVPVPSQFRIAVHYDGSAP